MSATHLGTRDRMFLILDDMEVICKEIILDMLAPKHQKSSQFDHNSLVDLLLAKDADWREACDLARWQQRIEDNMDEVRAKVNKEDYEIQMLQKQLKEAELILSTAIFQARQKLTMISQANKRPVSSEELIKYANRISSSNAVSAPLSWVPGDIRRPYPTDIEMRNGFLGKQDLNINGGVAAPFSQSVPGTPSSATDLPSAGFNQSQFNWPNLDFNMSMGPSGSTNVPLSDARGAAAASSSSHSNKEAASQQDDVEVMSTDSSSSSSSDSQ